MRQLRFTLLVFALTLSFAACQRSSDTVVELARLPLDSLDEVLTRSGAELDSDHSMDGGGSIRLVAEESTTFRLAELSELDVEAAQLVYQAQLRAENVEGQAYLEMWCRFPGQGEFFSRALHAPLTGSVEWMTQETPFVLQEGQNPDLIRLNVVIDGSGKVWVDQVRLLKAPLS